MARSAYEPVPASHPDHQWVAATLRGLAPAAPERAAVLELACGDGANLIPMAWGRPDARFVGFEGSGALEAARAGARELGLQNVDWVGGDLAALRRRSERFDYVVMHGVLSYVSGAARDAVLGYVAEVLTDGGVVYVDHLARAARQVEGRLRELIRRRVGPLPTVAERVTAIRALLDAMDTDPPDPGQPQAVHARVEITYAKGLDDAALIQHFLSPHRAGLAPSEVAALAARHGLAVFGAAWDPSPEREAEHRARARLAELGGDQAEDLLELVTGRRTHAVLLCRADALRDATGPPPVLARGTLAGALTTRRPDVLLGPDVEVDFRTEHGLLIRTRDPFNKAALTVLRDAWPAGVSFDALVKEARSRLGEGAAAIGDAEVARQAVELLALHQRGVIRWRSRDDYGAAEIPERPRVEALTAWQASRSALLTGPQHRLVVVDELTRRIVGLLDGARDAAAIAERVAEWKDELALPERPPVELVAEALEGLCRGGILRG